MLWFAETLCVFQKMRLILPKFGSVKLKIKGTNFANLLNLLQKQNIPLKNIKRQDSTTFVLKVKAKHCSKLVAILKEKCYNVIEQKSTASSVFDCLKRTGILVGLFLGLTLNMISGFFVCKIQLFGDKNFEKQILETLKQKGVCAFCPKSNLNFAELKTALYKNVDDLSLVSFDVRGSTLNVHFTTKTAKKSVLTEQTDVVAKNSGVVFSVVVNSGTAMVKPGDLVQKGDILILGVDENQNKVCASGQVFAFTFKSASLTFPLQTTALARTGKFVTSFKVTFLNQVLFEQKAQNPFSKFETETKENYLSTASIPLKICYTTFFEVAPVVVSQNFEENKEKLFAQAKLLAWQQIKGNEEILEEKTETNFVSDIWFVSHYIKIKEKIS